MRYICTSIVATLVLTGTCFPDVTYDLHVGVTQGLWDEFTDYEWTHNNVSSFDESETSYYSGLTIGQIHMHGDQDYLGISLQHFYIQAHSWIEAQNDWHLSITFDEPTEVFYYRYSQMLDTTWLGPLEPGTHYFAPGETLELTGLAHWTDGGEISNTEAWCRYEFTVVPEQVPCDTQLDPAPCNVDLDGNGAITVDDLLIVLGNFGIEGADNIRPLGDAAPFPSGDCVVNIDDLLMLLAHFGDNATGCGSCPDGEITDCNGNCCPETWLGDGYCDDGQYTWNGVPIYLNCDAYNCDDSDCACP